MSTAVAIPQPLLVEWLSYIDPSFLCWIGLAIGAGVPLVCAGYGIGRVSCALQGGVRFKLELFGKCMLPILLCEVIGLLGLVFFIVSSLRIAPLTTPGHVPNVNDYFAASCIFWAGVWLAMASVGAAYAIAVNGSGLVTLVSRHPAEYSNGVILIIFPELLSVLAFILSIISIYRVQFGVDTY